MLRRIGVLMSLAVVAVMFAGVSSAQASGHTGDSAVCVFTGLAGNLSPAIPPGPQVPPPSRGTYNFNGAATCAGTFSGSPYGPSPATITSDGEYYNIQCGTGWAQDVVTPAGQEGAGITTIDVSGTNAAGQDIPPVTEAKYEIPFTAGNGPIKIGTGQRTQNPFDNGAYGPDPVAGPFNGDPINTDHWTGSGFVHITPSNATSGGCVSQPVSSFEVAGSFDAGHR